MLEFFLFSYSSNLGGEGEVIPGYLIFVQLIALEFSERGVKNIGIAFNAL